MNGAGAELDLVTAEFRDVYFCINTFASIVANNYVMLEYRNKISRHKHK